VEPNPEQPRKAFDEGSLRDLAENIKALGLLQPILTRPHPGREPGRYQIVAGERRWRACQIANLDRVPIVVREVDDRSCLEIGLAENLLRDDLRPLEEAEMLHQLIERFSYTYEELGAKLGKGKNYIWHRTNLLKLPEDVREALGRSGQRGRLDVETDPEIGLEHEDTFAFSAGHAEAVGQIQDPELRAAVIGVVFDQHLAVAETRRRVRMVGEVDERFVDKRARERLLDAVLVKGIPTDDFHRRAGKMADRVTEAPPSKKLRGVSFLVEDLSVLHLLRQLNEDGQTSVDAAELIRVLQGDLKRLRKALSSRSAG
jgi:ParB/RepB/Spo0J family partition protein